MAEDASDVNPAKNTTYELVAELCKLVTVEFAMYVVVESTD